MPEFYDTHAHLDFPDFADNCPGWCSERRTPGSTGSSHRHRPRAAEAIDLAKQFDGVFAAVAGINDCMAAPDDVRAELERLAKRPRWHRRGGIDHYRLPSTRGGTEAEDEAFKARRCSCSGSNSRSLLSWGSVVIHSGQRSSRAWRCSSRLPTGCTGCSLFVDNPEAARRVLALGSIVSLPG